MIVDPLVGRQKFSELCDCFDSLNLRDCDRKFLERILTREWEHLSIFEQAMVVYLFDQHLGGE